MANVYIKSSGTPRISRNGKLYTGNIYNTVNNNNSAIQRHFETEKITDLEDYHVVIEFKKPFDFAPIPVNIKVYRMVENIPTSGKWIMQDVLHYFDDDVDWVVTTGFSIFIDDSEPLAGVIVEYCFTE